MKKKIAILGSTGSIGKTLIEIIKCLGVSEIKAKLSGGEPKHFRFAFNRYLDVFLNDLI